MLGAIIGDIVGSRFEFHNLRSKDFELLTADCFVTDDSILTLAVAKALLETVRAQQTTSRVQTLMNHPAAVAEPPDTVSASAAGAGSSPGQLLGVVNQSFHTRLARQTVKYLQQLGLQYPDGGYGLRFANWLYSTHPQPYDSYGNGAAMRVSPVAQVAGSLAEAEKLARTVTAVTHNHPEGIRGAQATAAAAWLAQNGTSKAEIRDYIARLYYPLDFEIDEIRSSYQFHESCQQTVPQAIECFLESADFEDAIRTAISLGGDSDTVAAICGSIAAAYYGIPAALSTAALTYLDPPLRAIYDEWVEFTGRAQISHG